MEWIENMDIKLLTALISSAVTIGLFILGWFVKFFYEKFSLNYKMKKEYEFEQKKKLKEEIAKTKIPLINSVEELNHRMFNFNKNIDKNWHKISKADWENGNNYYIQSFVYRFLVFLHWMLKTEKDTITIDSTIADEKDILYLQYIKTFKDIFTDTELLKKLGYKSYLDTNHFFKNNLVKYAKWVRDEENVIDFDVFVEKSKKEYDKMSKVIKYFSTIENDSKDKNLNVLKCFHLVAISFLNRYGHNYQFTSNEKLDKLLRKYSQEIEVKNEFQEFIEKSKLGKELKRIKNKI